MTWVLPPTIVFPCSFVCVQVGFLAHSLKRHSFSLNPTACISVPLVFHTDDGRWRKLWICPRCVSCFLSSNCFNVAMF